MHKVVQPGCTALPWQYCQGSTAAQQRRSIASQRRSATQQGTCRVKGPPHSRMHPRRRGATLRARAQPGPGACCSEVGVCNTQLAGATHRGARARRSVMRGSALCVGYLLCARQGVWHTRSGAGRPCARVRSGGGMLQRGGCMHTGSAPPRACRCHSLIRAIGRRRGRFNKGMKNLNWPCGPAVQLCTGHECSGTAEQQAPSATCSCSWSRPLA